MWILSVSIFLLIIGIGLFAFLYLRPEAKYERALTRAETYMKEKEYSTAIKYYEKALDIDSTKEVMKKHQKACLKNAEILFEAGKFEDALNQYDKVIQLIDINNDLTLYNSINHSKAECYLELGKENYKKDNFDIALNYYYAVYDYGADYQIDNANEEIIKCYIELAYEAMYSNDIQTAGDYFVTVLNMDNTCTKAYLGIAELEYQKDCYNTAMQWLNEGLDYVTDSDDRKLLFDTMDKYKSEYLKKFDRGSIDAGYY